MRHRKHKYPTDTEAGIRSITKIRSLPSGQLTDEEFAKEFFDRFQAKALILTYIDADNQTFCMGRLMKGAQPHQYYRGLMAGLQRTFDNVNIKEE